MNSKIGSILSVNKVLVSENRQQNRSNSSAGGVNKQGSESVSDDSVSITEAAQKLVEVENEINASPVIDRARIEAIKSAIADGSFRPDPEKIASKLMELEISLAE